MENDLKIWAKKIRTHVVKMAHDAKSAHVGSALSCVDILTCLFFDVMKPEDRFILSKGHGCMSYYAALKEKGLFDQGYLDRYSTNGGELPEHPPVGVNGIDVGTGSLGHGFAISVGCALARKIKKQEGTEFVLLGDGECNEGSIWESALFASNVNLNNIVAIVDRNKMQSAGFVDKSDISEKFRAFGWSVLVGDGNNINYLMRAFNMFRMLKNLQKPKVIIANTIKGKGVSFMENELLWHYRSPDDQELATALKEINDA